jgi:hypothetical protein
MSTKLKHKALSVTSTVLITAFTTGIAFYAGIHLHISQPGSVLVQAAVPVGASTMQQVLLMAWSEFSETLKKTCTA